MAVLCLVSAGLLLLLFPLALLPSSVTGVPSREFGVIHSSAVIVAFLRSAAVAFDIYLDRNGRKAGLICDIDAAV
jgi:hypothetical protein